MLPTGAEGATPMLQCFHCFISRKVALQASSLVGDWQAGVASPGPAGRVTEAAKVHLALGVDSPGPSAGRRRINTVWILPREYCTARMSRVWSQPSGARLARNKAGSSPRR